MNISVDNLQSELENASNETYHLAPHEYLADRIITVDKAVLAKRPNSEGFRIAASVFDSEQNPVDQAVCWVSHKLTATKHRSHPRLKRVKDLPGRWLFGGRFFPHFGHFMVETLARLWGLDHLDDPVQGVLFFSTQNNHAEAARKMFAQLSEILDYPINYKICDEFYRVDQLIVPPQASGLGRLTVCSPDFREFIVKHLKRDFEPTGCDKIYISRTGLKDKGGRCYLGENHLEELLRAEGYTIFHPQDHSWAQQLRYYLHATHILGADGSPFHLVNFTGRADVKVGIIQRRPTHDAAQIAEQGRLFGLGGVYCYKHVKRNWSSAGDQFARLRIISEISFRDLSASLREEGFINADTHWNDLSHDELKQSLNQQARIAGADQHPVHSLTESLEHHPVCIDEGNPQGIIA